MAADAPIDRVRCHVCGAALAGPGELAAPVAPVLVCCLACGAEQVVSGAPLCDGERAALRHALRYLHGPPR
jgi:hypothetical protein